MFFWRKKKGNTDGVFVFLEYRINSLKSVAIRDGYVIAGCDDGRIYCLDYNGNLNWKYETDNLVWSVAIRDGYVIAGCDDGRIYCLDYNGNLNWKYETDNLVWSVAIRDGYVIAGCDDGRIYALTTPKLVLSVIYKLNSELEEAKVMGIDIALGNKASKYYRRGNYGEALKEANRLINKVKEQIKDEVVKKVEELKEELKRYEELIAPKKLDEVQKIVDEVNTLISKGHYNLALNKINETKNLLNRIIELSNPILKLKLNEELRLNEWKKIKVEVVNEGNATANNVELEFLGDVEVKSINKIKRIKPGESKVVEASIKPTAEGEIPVDILVNYRNHRGEEKKVKETVWVKVHSQILIPTKKFIGGETVYSEQKEVAPSYRTPTKIPAKIDVKAPSEIKWNSCGILAVEITPESSMEGLTLDLSDLTRFFEVLYNRKPVTSIDFPPLRKGIKIVEEVKLIPKYKGEFEAELTFRWKNLRKSISMEINVKSIQHEFPIPKYEPVKLIGEGLTSYVWMCRKDDGSLVAVKIPKEEFGKEFIDELANWKMLNHLNIVELYDYNTYPNPYAEMELCDCPLSDVKIDSLELAITLAKVLDYAHNEGVIHGDLKPSNILLKNGMIKICDWGMGFTPAYAPPEVLEGNELDEKADIWSYGVVLYEHITGENPFQGKDDVEVYKKVIKVEPVFSGLGSLKSVIEKCLRKDPDERYNSFSEIKRELANTTIRIYSKRFTMSRGKERLSDLITLVNSYELSGDVKTAKERIHGGMELLKDVHSRRILEALKILIEIREKCLESIYKNKTIEADLIWVKFENLLSCLDDRLRQIIENDPYAGGMVKYIRMVSVNKLTRDELKKLYNTACERILCLLTCVHTQY